MTAKPESGLELARPVIGEREEELVLAALRSGRLSLGPMLERFETEFAAWLGAPYAVAVSSGTAALHLGVRALGWGAGDSVITSPLSFVASANCLLYEGVRPHFCDIDPETWNLDPAAVEAAVGPDTAGILPIHIYGYPADLPALEAIAERNRLGILEDACEALGAIDATGTRVGAGKRPATFGFYANKQLATGEGGMLVTGDSELAELARSERNQGREPDMGWMSHRRLGFNYRLAEPACALGIAQLERLGPMLAGRDRAADLYTEQFAGEEAIEVPTAGRGRERRSWFVFVIRIRQEYLGGGDTERAADLRDEIVRRLGSKGIPAKAYMPCLHRMPHLTEFGHRDGHFPVAESVAASTIALPFHPEMTEAEVERVSSAVKVAVGA